VVNLPSPCQFDAREIKRHADIFPLVSRYTRLQRAGRQYRGLCPFHSERHPSFYVTPEGLWNCFGCGLGGDIFAFVMCVENCDFRGALRIMGKHSSTPSSKAPSAASLASGWPRLEAFAEAAARIVGSLPPPGFVSSCSRCSAQMKFRSYRENRFGGAYHCASCSLFFGPRELKERLFAERGASCQWCRVSGSTIQMHHVLKKDDPFDPAFIVLLCPVCRGNVRKLLAIQLGIFKGRSPKGAERSEAPPLHSQFKATRPALLLEYEG